MEKCASSDLELSLKAACSKSGVVVFSGWQAETFQSIANCVGPTPKLALVSTCRKTRKLHILYFRP